ncbi:hypothetical protein [Aurantimonas sp. Leaf443]|uniref:hypothetical protein n=1 Tax=Aurantimonas sp. Leaf443 TaxID=1736378 RepID=UPI001FCD29BB|nr:hypothetical protein [Aurantimonas sp. Leaf443]
MGSHFMTDFRSRHMGEREKILADGLREVIAELRLVDVVDYIAFLRLERMANIADIVSSSAQLYMKPGTLTFADDGEITLGWSTPPVVNLEMLFRHAGVSAQFKLGLSAASAYVEIHYLAFEKTDDAPEANTAQLAAAVADARYRPKA